MTKDEAMQLLTKQRKAGGLASDATMRDYFAATALQALIRNGDGQQGRHDLARAAYGCADAMLAEREK